MGFFNDLGKKTSETTNKIAKKTSQTTSKIAKETKLKMKIADNKGKIKNIYEEIGKKVYESHIREERININEVIKSDCEDIDTLTKEIEDAKKEILVLNNKKICGKCFAEIEDKAMFCPQCGEKQTDEKTVLEKAEEKLEGKEIPEEKKKEAEAVKEELKEKNKKK